MRYDNKVNFCMINVKYFYYLNYNNVCRINAKLISIIKLLKYLQEIKKDI